MDTQKILAAVKQMSLHEIYAFAIERERDAQAFYKTAQALVNDPGGKAMLGDLYREEAAHEAMLTAAQRGGKFEFIGVPRGFADIGMADFLPETRVTADSSPQEVLIAAIKKEAFAASFYRTAGESTAQPAARELFGRLALEEQQHQNMLETWYDDHILTTN
jgi:rubrerythrin